MRGALQEMSPSPRFPRMKSSALITFLLIALFVWGGVALIVATAFRKEREKGRSASPMPVSSRPTES